MAAASEALDAVTVAEYTDSPQALALKWKPPMPPASNSSWSRQIDEGLLAVRDNAVLWTNRKRSARQEFDR